MQPSQQRNQMLPKDESELITKTNLQGELRAGKEIYRSRRTIVQRAFWVRPGGDQPQPVVAKTVAADQADPSCVARWTHEYRVLQHLGVAAAPVPLAFMVEQNVPVMLMEDFGGRVLRELIDAKTLTVQRSNKLAIKLADALSAVHERRVIHKDLNPTNIVVRVESDDVQIIDFGIASLLSIEDANIGAPNSVEGTLAYVSPEQTGRMNRSLDYRSDLYSFGIVLYEMLVGRAPFTSTDPLELIHAHLAIVPPAPRSLNPTIPEFLSRIVMKLLAKTAEERYQSAFGLKKDLEASLRQLETGASEVDIVLGAYDSKSQFQIPQKLYGRADEVRILLDAFDRVSRGAVEVLCVLGSAGIGKTAVVYEVHKPIVQKRGQFLSGKFDQFKRDVPYAPLIQAFQTLVRQLLAEDKATLATWKGRIMSAVGANGRVITNVISEVELIVGAQPAVEELAPAQSQERFNAVFHDFVLAFASAEHPLILFLDDLQWADLPSLNLLKLLSRNAAYLLTILAYRDNEVSEGHPLLTLLSDLADDGVVVNEIKLEELDVADATQLIADTVRQEPHDVRELAELCLSKTRGNAFFLGQFLQSLHRHEHITFDGAKGGWRWDMALLRHAPMTDNVVELMSGKLRELPRETQEVMCLAACLGNRFDLAVLSAVYGQSNQRTADALWPALSDRLVVPLDETYKFIPTNEHKTRELAPSYKFLHDRVQQAAYALIPEGERPGRHLQVGYTLLRIAQQEHLDDRLFDIVNHLTIGRDLIAAEKDRIELVRLCLTAVRKAKNSNAYASALVHAKSAAEILGERGWQEHYQLMFEASLERAICEHVVGNLKQADQLFESALARARTPLDRASLLAEMERLFLSLGKHQSVIDAVLRALADLGFHVPDQTKPDEILAAAAALKKSAEERLGTRTLDDLLELPEATDPVAIEAHKHLGSLAPSAFCSNMNLYIWLGAQNLELTIRTGNTPLSAFDLSVCGLSRLVLADLDTALPLAKLGVDLSDRYGSYHQKSACYFHSCLINSWKLHYKVDAHHARLAHSFSLESWNYFFIPWSAYGHVRALTLMGAPLDSIVEQVDQYIGLVKKLNRENSGFLIAAQRMALCLIGDTRSNVSYDDDKFKEDEFVAEARKNESPAPVFNYYIFKLQSLYLLNEDKAALELLPDSEPFIAEHWVEVTEYIFYRSLVMARAHGQASPSEKPRFLAEVEQGLAKLEKFATVGPANFLNRHLIVKAEHARIVGRDWEAMELYEAAIDAAREGEFTQNEALANELAATFWASKGKAALASHYLRQSLTKYRQWGAARKVQALVAKHPFLGEAEARARPMAGTLEAGLTLQGAFSPKASSFDVATIVKASQAISTEIVFERLLSKLMNIVSENAGAQRGLLLLRHDDGQWYLEAEWSADGGSNKALKATLLEQFQGMSHAVVRYVERTREALNIADVATDTRFAADAYVQRGAHGSVLCIPVANKGDLIAMLYLENGLTPGAFAANHIALLGVLSSQIAISIENARSFAQLEARVAERTAELVQARDALWGEMELAKRIQTVLLPKIPTLEGYEIVAEMRPADEVGGDYYDVIPMPGRDWVAIGDVSGHGVTAGLVMMMAQTAIRSVLVQQPEMEPSTLLDGINQVIVNNIGALDEADAKYMTLTVFAVARDGRLRYAGLHQDLFVYRAATGRVEIIETQGLWVGITESLDGLLEDRELVLQLGDVLMLYTDGVTEAIRRGDRAVPGSAPERFGAMRLANILNETGTLPLSDIKAAVLNALEQGYVCSDDVTLLLIRRL